MYSDKSIVNLTTSMFLKKGIRRVVLCPGSRNIPFIKNFTECPDFLCYSVTDERSAAFYALGISLATGEPVAVCVTSGSALLNTAPAVAEAYYRHVPLVVLSADRPREWIDRLDGQTVRQDEALANVVRQQASLYDIEDDSKAAVDFSSLLLNMTLNGALGGAQGPAHVNVHLKEPLFGFGAERLPEVRNISVARMSGVVSGQVEELIQRFAATEMGMIVMGQMREHDSETDRIVKELAQYYVVVGEPLASASLLPFESGLEKYADELKRVPVNFLVSMGGTLVSKRLKALLRTCTISEHWEVDEDGKAHDTFGCQTGVACCGKKAFLKRLLEVTKERKAKPTENDMLLRRRWTAVTDEAEAKAEEEPQDFSPAKAVWLFEQSLEDMDYSCQVHYANSTPVRLGCMYARHFIWCNRGVNGIDGSVSTAAGFSLATSDMVFCVTGDLSFFYDQNALWNAKLGGNLRVLLLNNGGGGIFKKLDGLSPDDSCMDFIAGRHNTNARGICEQNDIGYLQARSEEEYRQALVRLLTEQTRRPMVLEVIYTD